MSNLPTSAAEMKKMLQEAKRKQREPDYEKLLAELEGQAMRDLKDDNAHEDSYQKYKARWSLMFYDRCRSQESQLKRAVEAFRRLRDDVCSENECGCCDNVFIEAKEALSQLSL